MYEKNPVRRDYSRNFKYRYSEKKNGSLFSPLKTPREYTREYVVYAVI